MADSSGKLGPSEVDEDTFNKSVFEDGGTLLIDLSAVEEMKFEVLPKGPYDMVIDQVDFGKSKSSGQNMLTFHLKIEDGDYAGRKFYFYASFSPKALRGTKTNLIRIDPTLFGGQFNPQAVVESGTLLGRKITVQLGQQDGQNGEPQNNVSRIVKAIGANGEGASAGGGDAFFKS